MNKSNIPRIPHVIPVTPYVAKRNEERSEEKETDSFNPEDNVQIHNNNISLDDDEEDKWDQEIQQIFNDPKYKALKDRDWSRTIDSDKLRASLLNDPVT